MSLAAMIKNHLDALGMPYQIVTRSADQRVPPGKVAKNMILQDTDGLLVAVMGADQALDIKGLQEQMKRRIDLVPPHDYVVLFKDWAPSAFAPFARNYGLRILVDPTFTTQDCAYFENGNTDEYVRVDRDTFRRLHEKARFDLVVAAPLQPNVTATAIMPPAPVVVTPSAKAERMKFRIQKTTELPPMPEMAQKIFSLNSNPYAHVQDLAGIIAIDPSLSAQIVRYATSPFYGYRGRINSVHDAIARVLGYDLVMNIALGLASAAPFRHSRQGPLGLDAFWRHATYSAVLSQSLAGLIIKGTKPRPGMAYLAGLLHNFGYLLLGHLYPTEFNKLNDAVAAHPEVAVAELEDDIVGVSHGEIGAWLMEAWNMPPEVILSVREHHHAEVADPLAVYPQLIRLVDHLLKSIDLGDAPSREIPTGLIQTLGLTEIQIDTRMSKLLQSRDELDSIAQTLAA